MVWYGPIVYRFLVTLNKNDVKLLGIVRKHRKDMKDQTDVIRTLIREEAERAK